MTWAKPADLLVAYKYASESEWRRHIEWLRDAGYPWLKQLEKERARESRRLSQRPAAGSDG